MEAWTSSIKMPSKEEEDAWGRRVSFPPLLYCCFRRKDTISSVKSRASNGDKRSPGRLLLLVCGA